MEPGAPGGNRSHKGLHDGSMTELYPRAEGQAGLTGAGGGTFPGEATPRKKIKPSNFITLREDA